MQALYTFLATTTSVSWQIFNLGGMLLFNHIVRYGSPTADPALEMLLNVDEAQGGAFTRSVALSFRYNYARGQWLLGNLDEVRRVYRLVVTKTKATPISVRCQPHPHPFDRAQVVVDLVLEIAVGWTARPSLA